MLGKVSIVTGGHRGLGRAISELLLTAGSKVHPLSTKNFDVCDFAAAQRYVETIRADFGRIDVLVNNAAMLGPVGLLENNSWREWQDTIDINLLGPVNLCRLVVPIMREQGYGKIINICGGGATGSLPRRSAYATAKCGLARFTECLADELKGTHIDVNAVLPGPMDTDMMQEMLNHGPEKLGTVEYREHLVRPKLSPEMAAKLVVYLASKESDGVTGRILSARFDDFPFSDEWKLGMDDNAYKLRRVDQFL